MISKVSLETEGTTMKTTSILCAIAALSLTTACAMRQHDVLNIDDTPYTMGPNDDPGPVIASVLKNRGWAIIEESPGVYVAQYAKPNPDVEGGAHLAVIQVNYDADSYSIDYVDSTGLMYDGGSGVIHRNYNRWVANLQHDLAAHL